MIKILIVEDSDIQRKTIADILAVIVSDGYYLDTTFAINFDDAMGYIAQDFNIVCADHRLSSKWDDVENGTSILEKFRKSFKDDGLHYLISYSAVPESVPRGKGFNIIDKNDIGKEIKSKIKMIIEKQTEQQQEKESSEPIIVVKEKGAFAKLKNVGTIAGSITAILLLTGIIWAFTDKAITRPYIHKCVKEELAPIDSQIGEFKRAQTMADKTHEQEFHAIRILQEESMSERAIRNARDRMVQDSIPAYIINR